MNAVWVGAGCLIGFTVGTIVAKQTGWERGDWIQFSQAIGLWVTGALGAWFVLHQNRILSSQNVIMERQLAHEQGLIAVQNSVHDADARRTMISALSKTEFRRARNQRGLLQMVGANLRRRFPEDLRTIVEAYNELAAEAPELGLLPLHEFINLMRMYENVDWPDLR